MWEEYTFRPTGEEPFRGEYNSEDSPRTIRSVHFLLRSRFWVVPRVECPPPYLFVRGNDLKGKLGDLGQCGILILSLPTSSRNHDTFPGMGERGSNVECHIQSVGRVRGFPSPANFVVLCHKLEKSPNPFRLYCLYWVRESHPIVS